MFSFNHLTWNPHVEEPRVRRPNELVLLSNANSAWRIFSFVTRLRIRCGSYRTTFLTFGAVLEHNNPLGIHGIRRCVSCSPPWKFSSVANFNPASPLSSSSNTLLPPLSHQTSVLSDSLRPKPLVNLHMYRAWKRLCLQSHGPAPGSHTYKLMGIAR